MRQITLEEYRIQRDYREQRRKEYLNQFQKLRHGICLQPLQPASQPVPQSIAHQIPQPQSHSAIQPPNPQSNPQSSTESQLLQQNTRLRQEIAQIERSEKAKITRFKQQMESAKTIYFSRIKELREIELTAKKQTQTKISKLQQQIKSATAKNDQISKFNSSVQLQCNKADQLMSQYASQLSKQYDTKLQEFTKIYTSSSEKIQAMESQYNEEQFVTSTLQNEELINSMRDNVDKAGEDVDKILADYGELLKGKSEIMVQLKENNQMKQDEIGKMVVLEQKLKTICEKLQEEKKMYLDQNKRMAEELLEIKELLTKVMAGEGNQ